MTVLLCRDAAILSVLRATGVRLAELAGIRYDPGSPGRSDLDLEHREIRVRGKGGKDRIVRIDHEAAHAVDRYLRVRSRHAQAHRPRLWLGVNNRGPMTASGIYQMVARRGKQCGWMCGRTGSGTISATPGWTAAGRRAT